GGGWVGPYIGESLGRARSIVHFDPMVAAARNRPTAIAITGEPGGGKTTLALLMIYQLALRGVTVAAIDPKGDAESLVELLRHRGRKARRMSLGSAQPGLLDPCAFGDDLAAKKTMATETLRLLLPRMSEERESAMIQAVAAVANQPRPSLAKVVDHLCAASGAAARNLGAVLQSMAEMRLASLCFDQMGDATSGAYDITTAPTAPGPCGGPPLRGRRCGGPQPGRWPAVHGRDAPCLPVFRPAGGCADRHRGVDHGVHPGWAHPARFGGAARRLLLRATPVGGVAVLGVAVRPAVDERPGPAPAQGDLLGRGLGGHFHARGRQARPGGVPDGPVPQHR